MKTKTLRYVLPAVAVGALATSLGVAAFDSHDMIAAAAASVDRHAILAGGSIDLAYAPVKSVTEPRSEPRVDVRPTDAGAPRPPVPGDELDRLIEEMSTDRTVQLRLLQLIEEGCITPESKRIAIIQWLQTTGDPGILAALTDILGRLEKAHIAATARADVAAAIAALGRGTPRDRMGAIDGIHADVLQDETMIATLTEIVRHDANIEVARAAVLRLAGGATEIGDAVVLEVLEDRSAPQPLRAAAAQGLALNDSPRAAEALIERLRDTTEDPAVQRLAATGLGHQATTDEVVETLVAICQSATDRSLRQNAVSSLQAHARHPLAERQLWSILEADDSEVARSAALMSLMQAGADYDTMEQIGLNDPSPMVRGLWTQVAAIAR